MGFIRNAASIGFAAGVGIAASVLTPTAAQAYVPGPPCYASSCNGQDPYITNRDGVSCVADAYTVTDANGNPVRVTVPNVGYTSWVDLRYSPFCHANWARMEDAVPFTPTFKYSVYESTNTTAPPVVS